MIICPVLLVKFLDVVEWDLYRGRKQDHWYNLEFEKGEPADLF